MTSLRPDRRRTPCWLPVALCAAACSGAITDPGDLDAASPADSGTVAGDAAVPAGDAGESRDAAQGAPDAAAPGADAAAPGRDAASPGPDASAAGPDAGSAGADAAVVTIGPRPVTPTPVSKGTLFVAPSGTGTTCSLAQPCALATATGKVAPGDVVFLRGGVYSVTGRIRLNTSGTAAARIVYESYPGELAILDGSTLTQPAQGMIAVYGSFISLRLIEVRRMPESAVYLGGNDNVVEGVHSHHNFYSGIQAYSPYTDFPYGSYGSRNVIRDCVVHDNSDVGGPANGGNADGISISSGADNVIEHCLVYGNSDDGIDTWRSTGSIVRNTLVYGSGLADGNGNGFKAGGLAPSEGTLVEHCISYRNQSSGFDFNSGKSVVFRHNTSWDNADWGYVTGSDTLVEASISSSDGSGTCTSAGTKTGNSWQRSGTVSFVSTDPTSPDFLRPTPGGGFEDLGAYAR